MIAAHGNSLRALVKGLESLGDDEVAQLEIPTGEPRIYNFDRDMQVANLKILRLPNL
jgi:2,3-bisphosphoglycerate-dependent phosphoglycerate mutase